MQNDPAGSGVSAVANTPSHEAIGGHAVRATNLPEDVLSTLDEVEDATDCRGRREAVAVLLEFYHSHPREVLDAEPVGGGGNTSIRARRVHKRHKKLLYDLIVELGDTSTREALQQLCGAYRENAKTVVEVSTPPRYR